MDTVVGEAGGAQRHGATLDPRQARLASDKHASWRAITARAKRSQRTTRNRDATDPAPFMARPFGRSVVRSFALSPSSMARSSPSCGSVNTPFRPASFVLSSPTPPVPADDVTAGPEQDVLNSAPWAVPADGDPDQRPDRRERSPSGAGKRRQVVDDHEGRDHGCRWLAFRVASRCHALTTGSDVAVSCRVAGR
jgi:hypothetical protein